MDGKKDPHLNENNPNVCQLLDHFVHIGIHGKHPVMIFDLSGVNLLEVIKKYK